jgi:iron complex outermembrane recepter protein
MLKMGVGAAALFAAGFVVSKAEAQEQTAPVQQAQAQASAPQTAASQGQAPAQSLEAIEVKTVTATATPVKQSRAPAAVTVIGGAPSEGSASASAEERTYGSIQGGQIEKGLPGRIGEVLETTPGIYMRGSALGQNRPGNSSGTMTLRGIPGATRTLIVVDGVTLNSPYAGTVDYSLISMTGVDHIEVAPGAFSSLYGTNAMGGVINIMTKAPEKTEFYTEGSLGGTTPRTQHGAASYRDRFSNGLGIALDLSFTNGEGFADEAATKTFSATKPSGVITPVTGVTVIPTSAGSQTGWIGDRGERPWQTFNAGMRLYYDFSETTRVTAGTTFGLSESSYDAPHSYLRDAAGNPVYTGTVSFKNANGLTQYMKLTDPSSSNPFMNFAPTGEYAWRSYVKGETKLGDVKITTNLNYSQSDAWFISPTAKSTLTATSDGVVLGGPGTLTPAPQERLQGVVQADIPVTSWNLLTVGTSWQRDSFSRNIYDLADHKDEDSKTGAISYETQGWAELSAMFLQDKIDITDRLTLYLGGRFDYWTTAGPRYSARPRCSRPYRSLTSLIPSMTPPLFRPRRRWSTRQLKT